MVVYHHRHNNLEMQESSQQVVQRSSNLILAISFKLQAYKFEWTLCLFNRPWFRAGKIALLMPSPPRLSPSRRLPPDPRP